MFGRDDHEVEHILRQHIHNRGIDSVLEKRAVDGLPTLHLFL